MVSVVEHVGEHAIVEYVKLAPPGTPEVINVTDWVLPERRDAVIVFCTD